MPISVYELLALLMDSIDFSSGGPVDGYALKIGFGLIRGVAEDVNLDTPLRCVAKNYSLLILLNRVAFSWVVSDAQLHLEQVEPFLESCAALEAQSAQCSGRIVDAIDALEHCPSGTSVESGILREIFRHHGRCVYD